MRIEEDIKLDYKDVLVIPKRSTLKSRRDVNLLRKFNFKNKEKELEVVPVIAANMDGVGTMSMFKSLSENHMMTALHKHYSLLELKKFFNSTSPEKLKYVFYTIGLNGEDLEKLEKLISVLKKDTIQNISIDVANGYTEHFINFVKKVREKYPKKIIMAGNVVTPEMTEQLILSGADIVKIGIGPGSTCITRKIAGVGYPQLSAVIACSDAAHGMGGRICADGGCQVPGDITKAIGGGADFVMLGGMLAGHKESEQKIHKTKDGKFLHFYGSSSEDAMNKHYGGVGKYRANEGKAVKIPYLGKIEPTIQKILGGLRSACTYTGAANLKELPKRTTFIKVNRQLNDLFD